jgi:alpha-galactosidase
MRKILFCTTFVLLCILSVQAQKIPGLALTPPMGWNSWNTFQTNINEKMVMEIADSMVSSGMKDAGFTYIVLDDGWMAMERNSNGDLVPDPKKFPNGIKVVADYVHAKGLKFGLYNCAGTKTCAGYPGTRGYEYQDARFYASAGIDYLKYDWCYTDGINAKEAYNTMSRALTLTGRHIIFSLCEWGQSNPWEWAANTGHLWRTTGDIFACYDCVKKYDTWSAFGVVQIMDKQNGLRKFAGPGHWNDPDMLEVGVGLSDNENKSHFTIWSMLAAPLIAGNDIRKMSAQTKTVLTNKEIVALNQDSLGIQGFVYNKKDSIETWVKPLNNGAVAISFLNRSVNPATITFNWAEHTIIDSVFNLKFDFINTTYSIKNLWLHKEEGNTAKPYKAILQGHDVAALRLQPIKQPAKNKKN